VLAQHSVLAVAVGHVAVAFLISLTRLAIAIHLLGLSARHTFAQFIPAITGGVIMGAGVLAIINLTRDAPEIIALGLAIITGATSYIIALWWLERSLMQRVLSMVRSRLGWPKPIQSHAINSPE
jgi:hypothetical protein